MNDRTNNAVIDHVEVLAAAAMDEVDVPAFERAGSGTRRPRRWGLLAAAAGVALLAAVGLGWWNGRTDEVRTVDDPVQTLRGQGERLVPTEWPSGLTGEIVTTDPSDSADPYDVERRAVLSHRGRAAATVTAIDFPMGMPETTPYEEFELAGRRALWMASGPGGSAVSIAAAAGQTVSVASPTATRAELEALVSAMADAEGDPTAADLPEGWNVVSDPADIVDVVTTGRVDGSWSSVSQRVESGLEGLTISTRTVEDADDVVTLAAELAGADGTPLDLTNDTTGLLVEFPPSAPAAAHEAVLWAPAPGVVAAAVGDGIGRDALIAAVRSTRSVSAAEWDALREPEDAVDTRTVDGFQIPNGSTVIGTGDDFGVEWIVTEDRFDVRGEPRVSTSLQLRDESGVFGGGGGGSSGGGVGVGFSRTGPYVTLTASVPAGSIDATFEVLGREYSAVQVSLPDGRSEYAFAVLPGRDTPDLSDAILVTATLSDGSRFTSPPDLVPG